jgi:hypothetical protein
MTGGDAEALIARSFIHDAGAQRLPGAGDLEGDGDGSGIAGSGVRKEVCTTVAGPQEVRR